MVIKYTLIMYLLATIIITAPGVEANYCIDNASKQVEKWITDAHIGSLDIRSVFIYPPDGDEADYLITAENKFSFVLQKAVIIVQLAPGMKFINSTKAPQKTPNPRDDHQSLAWTQEELEPGPENSFSIILQLDTNGQNEKSELEKTTVGAAASINGTRGGIISAEPVASSAFEEAP